MERFGAELRQSFATMRHALQAAKENDVQEVYATLWGDDGAENH